MKDIFRKSALDNLSTPEQLDRHVKIMKPHLWIFLCIFLVLFICMGTWVIFGTVTTSQKMEGIVFPKLGIEKVLAKGDGVVRDVLYKSGDFVEAGDIIAVIENKKLLSEIEKLQMQYGQAKGLGDRKQIKLKIEKCQNQYEQEAIVCASQSGVLQNIVSVNENIVNGNNIADILLQNEASDSHQIVAYVPMVVANQLKMGMEAQVCPAYVSREEYGYMKGYIVSIGSIPVTVEDIDNYYGNQEYIQDILPESASVEIRIALNVDEDSGNGFQWSNGKGENLEVDVGTICNIQVVTRNQKPIELLLN